MAYWDIKIAILQADGPNNFAILSVGGIVRPPHMTAYGGNCAGGWLEKFCNSVGGWSDNSSVVSLPTNFLME